MKTTTPAKTATPHEMKNTAAAAIASTTIDTPPDEGGQPSAEDARPFDYYVALRVCAEEVGAVPREVETCTIPAKISHLLPELLTPEEKEHLEALERKSAMHKESVDSAYAMPATPVAAAKELVEAGNVPTQSDYDDFEMAPQRRKDRCKIAKLAARTFYKSEVVPFVSKICSRAALRLQAVNIERARAERETCPPPDKDIIGDIEAMPWRPSIVLVALAKLRFQLWQAAMPVSLDSPRTILSRFGLGGLL